MAMSNEAAQQVQQVRFGRRLEQHAQAVAAGPTSEPQPSQAAAIGVSVQQFGTSCICAPSALFPTTPPTTSVRGRAGGGARRHGRSRAAGRGPILPISCGGGAAPHDGGRAAVAAGGGGDSATDGAGEVRPDQLLCKGSSASLETPGECMSPITPALVHGAELSFTYPKAHVRCVQVPTLRWCVAQRPGCPAAAQAAGGDGGARRCGGAAAGPGGAGGGAAGGQGGAGRQRRAGDGAGGGVLAHVRAAGTGGPAAARAGRAGKRQPGGAAGGAGAGAGGGHGGSHSREWGVADRMQFSRWRGCGGTRGLQCRDHMVSARAPCNSDGSLAWHRGPPRNHLAEMAVHRTASCPAVVCIFSHWHISLQLLSPVLLRTPQERDQFWKKELSDRALEAAELERRLRAATEGAARDAEALQVRPVGPCDCTQHQDRLL